MKLLAITLLGFVALVSSDANIHHHNTQNQAYDVQGHINNRHHNQENERTLYNQNQQLNQGQNNEYDELNWNTQSSHYQNKQIRPNSQGQYYAHDNQWSGSQTINDEDLNQHYSSFRNQDNQNYGSYSDSLNSDFTSELNFREDTINDQIYSNIDSELGRIVAQKMVKFFYIVDKYAARNGTVQTNQAQEPLTLRQWALPMANHQFLNMLESKVYGINQGIIKNMYVSTEINSVGVEYFFDSLLVKGNFKSSMGPNKKSFDLKMTNTFVNVSTELENHNRNRNHGHSRNENIQLNYENSQDSSDSQLINENIESKYVQFMNRAIESAMIDYSYNGLVGCLRSEVESTLDIPSGTEPNLVIENKKSQLTVSLVRTQTRNGNRSQNQRKVSSVVFHQNQFGNGYKLKVKIILANQPTWESNVVAQKGHEQINIQNVNFNAQNIFATVVMGRVQQPNGDYKFNVDSARVQFQGLKYDIGKFNLIQNENENLAREVGQNLQTILENGMSSALQQQLYQQQQIIQQNPMEFIRCNQFNNQ